MADSIALKLTSNGTEIPGDNPNTSLERANTIEVLSFSQPSRRAFEHATGRATARRYYEPITFTKRIDRASPLLRKALTENALVTAKFMWYRRNPNGDGTTQKFFTLAVADGRISSADARLMNTLDPALAGLPPLEEIQLTFNKISWTFEIGGISHQDDWEAFA